MCDSLEELSKEMHEGFEAVDKKIADESGRFDRGFKKLGGEMKSQRGQMGKMASETHDAMMDASITRTIVEGLEKSLEREHREDREDHKEIWTEIDGLKKFKYQIIGGAMAVSAIVSLLFKMFG